MMKADIAAQKNIFEKSLKNPQQAGNCFLSSPNESSMTRKYEIFAPITVPSIFISGRVIKITLHKSLTAAPAKPMKNGAIILPPAFDIALKICVSDIKIRQGARKDNI